MTPEIRIQKTIKKLKISSPQKEKEIYEKVLNTYYERYIKTIFGLLNPDDQSKLADLIDSHASETMIESFVSSRLPEITKIAEDSLDAFLFEYEDRMGLTA